MSLDLPRGGVFGALRRLLEKVASDLPEDVVVNGYIAGGIGVLVNLHLAHKGSGKAVVPHRVSDDLDMGYDRNLLRRDMNVRYDENGTSNLLVLDTSYTEATFIQHPDARSCALPIGDCGGGRLKVHVYAPIDISIMKLGRLEAHDVEDICAMARAGLLDAARLRAQAEEALDYYVGDQGFIRHNITRAEQLIRNCTPTSAGPSKRK